MRRLIALLLVSAFIFVACGGQTPGPTPASSPPQGTTPTPTLTPRPTATPVPEVIPDEPSLVLEPISGEGGGMRRVGLRLSQVKQVAGLQLEIAFNADVVQAEQVNQSKSSDFLFVHRIDNEAGIIAIATGGATAVKGNSEIAELIFRVVGQQVDPNLELEVHRLKIVDASGNPVPVTLVNHTLKGL